MRLPLQISFRNMERSEWIEASIWERVEKLEKYFDGIMSCRVVVEIPHKHHHQGNFFQILIDLTVPGEEIVINREASEHAASEDFSAVIRDAFDCAKRRLDDYAHRKRGYVKFHQENDRKRLVAAAAEVSEEATAEEEITE